MSDFDQIINRTKTNSIKWHVAKNELPMWIADMDFKTSPAIVKHYKKRFEMEFLGMKKFRRHTLMRWQIGMNGCMVFVQIPHG